MRQRGSAPHYLRIVRAIGHQPPGLNAILLCKHAWQALLNSELRDLSSILNGHGIIRDKQCVGTLFGHSGKSDLEVLWALHLVRLKGHSKCTGRTLRLSPSEWVRRISAIPQFSR